MVMQIFFPSIIYKKITKPIFFLFDPEAIHNFVTTLGEIMGETPFRNLLSLLYAKSDKRLEQKILKITFKNPVGLAAGFDYDARLSQILPSFGFGFHTVGTITYLAYSGNPKPILGRLPKSRSLMVNKGFKNRGAKNIADKLNTMNYDIPLGISIGKSNTDKINTQEKSIKDIISTFKLFEDQKVKNSYYEINISCPNLKGNVTFYPPDKLDKLQSRL